MEAQKKKMSTGKKILIAIGALVVLGIIGNQFGGNKKPAVDVKSADSTTVATAPVEPMNTWQYEEDTDKMTSKIELFASVEAKEKLQFNFPYAGGSTATFMIRKKDGKTSLLLLISKGQFHYNYGEQKQVRIRFDDTPAKNYNYSEASDGSSDVIFLNDEKGILAQIKASKKMLIEAEFYQEGNRTMEFNVEGLKW